MPFVATPWIGRRTALTGIGAAFGAALIPAALRARAGGLTPTPVQMEGPFYPVSWSGDADNDLVIVAGEAARAIGHVLHLTGRVRTLKGEPVSGALVEIWQCDAGGVYRHPMDAVGARRPDAGFQGRGRTRTDAGGHYAFRTIRPVPYPGRTPHIHFRIVPKGAHPLVTQMYVYGEPLNSRDGLLHAIGDPRQRDAVIVRLDAGDRLEAGALIGKFDIVLG